MDPVENPEALLEDLKKLDDDGRTKYIPGVNQPRDDRGQFRKVLARIKENLGVSGLQRALERVEEVEQLGNVGNYVAASNAAAELKSILERMDTGALSSDSIGNIRETAKLLGTAMAYIPLPFGSDTEKIKFSDLPPVLKELIDDMTEQVEDKIGSEDAAGATKKLKSFKSGSDVLSQAEIASELNTLMRLLT